MSENLSTMPTHTVTDGWTDNGSTTDQWNGTDVIAEVESGQGNTFDLSMLWEMLKSHNKAMGEKEDNGKNINSTWELIIIQGVLLALLVLLTVCWALCCRKRSNNPTVVEALKKLSNTPSKGLPPSYSVMDLFSQGLSVHDYLHPPPEYPADSLQYLDLEAGHRRMSRLSFGSSDGVAERLGRLSVASCDSCSSGVYQERIKRQSKSSVSSTRDLTSSRNSKSSFSEECSLGYIRRLSSNTLFNLQANSNSSSRKSSSSSEGSRRSSLASKYQRKMGSNNNEMFIGHLDEKLQQKLDSIGEPETTGTPQARACDVIVEEK